MAKVVAKPRRVAVSSCLCDVYFALHGTKKEGNLIARLPTVHFRLLETSLREPAQPANFRNCHLIALIKLDYPYVSLETGAQPALWFLTAGF